MSNIVILLGKMASGKSSIQKELIDMGMSNLITYTSRPKRKEEVDGVDYHFITYDEFREKEALGFFAETTSYDTVYGVWLYGSAIEDISNDKVCVLNPSGYWQLKNNPDLDITSIYIDVKKRNLKRRLKVRGDRKDEAKRRMKTDKVDFKGIKESVDYVIDGNKKSPQALAIEIIRMI